MDDSISRQEAIDALVKRSHLSWEYLKIVNPILNVLEELPSAPRWIPYSERMPEKGEDVIIWLKEKDLLGKNMRVAHLGDHSIEDKDFNYLGEKVVWYCDIYYCSLDAVIAWMPRPKDYKGNSND